MKKRLGRIWYYFSYCMKLRDRLLVSYILLIVLPLILFTLWNYGDVSRTLMEQFRYSSEQSTRQTGIYLDKVMDDLTTSARRVAIHEMIPNILENDAHEKNITQIFQNQQTLTGIMESILPMDMLYSAQLYVDEDIYYARKEETGEEGIRFLSLEMSQTDALQELLQNRKTEICWSFSKKISNRIARKETDVIAGARYIKNNLTYDNIGILVLNIPRNYLDDLIGRAAVWPGSLALLLDAEGNLIAASDDSLLQKYSGELELIASEAIKGERMVELAGEEHTLESYIIDGEDWVLVSVLPYDVILKTSTEARNKMLAVMLVIGLLFFVVAYSIADLITRRMRKLNERIRSVQLDDFSQITSIEGSDEVSELATSYNYMLGKINAYAESQYELGMELKKSELEALQAQINPHFLYNTLDMIHWISESYGSDEISEIVSLLSKFYRLSLSNGKDVVTVGTALQHIDVYVRLQNYRFDDSVQIKMNMEEEVYRYGILKLLLQPIVENSIIHGILEKEDQQGLIVIEGTVRQKEDGIKVLHITVTDDGIGMTPETIAKMADISGEDTAETQGGYGIRNVISRIKLYYGDEYGLVYESIPGKGTTVIMEIPCMEIREEKINLRRAKRVDEATDYLL